MAYEAATYAPGQKESQPLRRFLTTLYNDYHEGVRRLDGPLLRKIEGQVPELLAELETSAEVEEHDNPEVLICVMRAGWAFAQDNLPEAYQFNQLALLAATYPPPGHIESLQQQRIGRLAANLCEIARKRGDAAQEGPQHHWRTEALKWARLATAATPADPTYQLELAMALDDSGDVSAAEQILADIVPLVNFADPKNALAARIRFQFDLHRRSHLPSVRQLVDEMNKFGKKD